MESSEGQQAVASLAINYYDTPTCFGAAFDGRYGGSTVGLDQWELLTLDVEPPVGVQGARLRLLVGTTSDEVWDVARFDEVQYVPEAGGGAAWGAGALLALAARARRGRPHAESSSG